MMTILPGLDMQTFLIKLGDTTIITDPVFSKNMGPWIFGPKRYVDPAVDLNENSGGKFVFVNSQSL